MQERNLILAGLGPHARRIYYPLIEKYSEQYKIKVPLIVELKDQENKIRNYLSKRKLQPDKMLFIANRNRQGEQMDKRLLLELDKVATKSNVNGMIIATEPKAHKTYVIWALERNIDILMDKPITSPVGSCTDVDSARKIYEDYLEMDCLLKESKSNLIVQCQRRNHEGYKFIRRYLEDFVKKYQIPISYIDVYHADGGWYMPDELFYREGHPYQYGYGKMMHSGYHFINLFVWLSEINNNIELKKPEFMDLFVKTFRAYDFLHQIDNTSYYELFKTNKFSSFFKPAQKEKAKRFGELDVSILCQLKRRDVVITTASINLLASSFSRRSWLDLPEDTYRSNGRIRHERVNIQVSNLLNIQVHSYQSYEVNKNDVQVEGAGHKHHFDVYIFRNSRLIGGNTLEKLSIGEEMRKQHIEDSSYMGLQEKAKEGYFVDFLEGRTSTSYFTTHRLTNKLLSKIYECMAKESSGDIPYTSFDI